MDSLLLCWDSVLSTMWESMVISHATLRQRGRSWTEVWSGLCYLIEQLIAKEKAMALLGGDPMYGVECTSEGIAGM